MSRRHEPGVGNPGQPGLGLRQRRAALFGIPLVLCLLLASWVAWPANARHLATTLPPLTANPTSGAPGSSIDLTSGSFPRVTVQHSVAFSFDGATITPTTGPVTVATCTGSFAASFGFGTSCTGSAVTIQVPQNASPGQHTIAASVFDDSTSGQDVASASFTVTAQPTITLNPDFGPAGTTTSVSVVNLPSGANGLTGSISFNGATIAQPVLPCGTPGAAASYGFGFACNGNNVELQVPPSAQPGPMTVAFFVSGGNLPAPISLSATFTVVAGATATPTATATATLPAATGTATATSTATSTLVPSAPTFTATATSTATATATSTPSPTPVVLRFPVLVVPAFGADSLVLSLRGMPNASVHIVFAITSLKTNSTLYKLTVDRMTNAIGIYAAKLHINFPAHTPGRATLAVTLQEGGQTLQASRSFKYLP